jgi:type IV pilus assembly protein PilV
MTGSSHLKHHQSGAYLLEALIGILIFSLGVLGIVGLQAASLRSTSDDSLRAEAVLAANEYIGQMWADNVDDPNLLIANYSTAFGGPKYVEFVNKIPTAFGGAYDPAFPPDVTFRTNVPYQPSTSSKYVQVVITWKSCSTQACTNATYDYHNAWTSAVIGTN